MTAYRRHFQVDHIFSATATPVCTSWYLSITFAKSIFEPPITWLSCWMTAACTIQLHLNHWNDHLERHHQSTTTRFPYFQKGFKIHVLTMSSLTGHSLKGVCTSGRAMGPFGPGMITEHQSTRLSPARMSVVSAPNHTRGMNIYYAMNVPIGR
jgi:hypothetical protein